MFVHGYSADATGSRLSPVFPRRAARTMAARATVPRKAAEASNPRVTRAAGACSEPATSPKTRLVKARPMAVPMPRVMLSTPLATPDCALGAEPMMAALFGGVNIPRPIPRTASSTMMAAREPWATMSVPIMAADMAMPATVSGRAPSRSASRPAKGAVRPSATGMTPSRRPLRPGLWCRARSR